MGGLAAKAAAATLADILAASAVSAAAAAGRSSGEGPTSQPGGKCGRSAGSVPTRELGRDKTRGAARAGGCPQRRSKPTAHPPPWTRPLPTLSGGLALLPSNVGLPAVLLPNSAGFRAVPPMPLRACRNPIPGASW